MNKTGRILGSVLLLTALAWMVKWNELAAAFGQIDWRLWALAVGVMTAAQIVSSWRWQLLARVLHFGGALRHYVAYYFIGMLFNLVLPTSVGGDVVRAWYLSAREGSPPPTGRRLEAFLTVFAERLTGVLMLVLLACVSTLFCPMVLPPWIKGLVAFIGSAAVVGLLGLVWIAHPGNNARGPASLSRLGARVRKLAVVQRLLDVVRRYWGRRDVVLAALGLSVVVQAANVQMSWFVLHALGLPIPWLYLGATMPLVSLLVLLPISVNGLGLREFGLILMLGPMGVTVPQAITVSLLKFALTLLISLSAGLFCYLFVGEVVRNEDPVRGDSDQGRTGKPSAAA